MFVKIDFAFRLSHLYMSQQNVCSENCHSDVLKREEMAIKVFCGIHPNFQLNLELDRWISVNL